jgi:membrane protease YdiL (CAAX protease family)
MQTGIIIVSFSAYLLLVFRYKVSSDMGAKDLTEVLLTNSSLGSLNRRMIQTLPLMLLSVILYSFSYQDRLLQFKWRAPSALTTILLPGLCALISMMNARQSQNVIKSTVAKKESVPYFSIRIPGLIIYEVFFRGVLLGILMELFSKPVAVALNIALYGIAHAFGSRKEFIGSLPFGLLLCFVTVLTQSVYPAVLLHLCIALPYESILLNTKLTKN